MEMFYKEEGIEFIDRILKPGEKTHYRCRSCGLYLHQDFAYSHKCNTLLLEFQKLHKKELNRLEKVCFIL